VEQLERLQTKLWYAVGGAYAVAASALLWAWLK
jgi:hypothetical protein